MIPRIYSPAPNFRKYFKKSTIFFCASIYLSCRQGTPWQWFMANSWLVCHRNSCILACLLPTNWQFCMTFPGTSCLGSFRLSFKASTHYETWWPVIHRNDLWQTVAPSNVVSTHILFWIFVSIRHDIIQWIEIEFLSTGIHRHKQRFLLHEKAKKKRSLITMPVC